MSKINCNIIKDLMPSYMDEICSTESRKLIDEHFTECEDCKKLYEQMKLESLHIESIEDEDVNYLKKISDKLSHKNMAILISILILLFLEIYINYTQSISNPFNYFCFIPLTGGLLFTLLPDYGENTIPIKLKFCALGIEIAAVTYSFLLLLCTSNSILNGNIPFGMKAEQIGPFLSGHIQLILWGFIAAFLATLFLSIKKKAVCPALIFTPLGGIAILFEYRAFLHEFTSGFTIAAFRDPTILLIMEVLVLFGIYMLVNRKKVS